jgi:hypothetical protein
VSVVVFGDLFQLKPVMDSWIFSQPFGSLECLGANLWADHFSLYELDEIMRQKEDLSFAQLLNRLREGKMEEQDILVLKSRKLEAINEHVEIDNLPHLFTTVFDASSGILLNIFSCKRVHILPETLSIANTTVLSVGDN